MDEYEAKALLEWYAEAGVDEAVANTPVDRFATASVTATPKLSRSQTHSMEARQASAPPATPLPGQNEADRSAAPSSTGARPSAATGSEDPIAEARSLAAKAQSLEELEAFVRDFNGCSLKTTAKHTCFADGSPQGGIMFIGEAPGRDEDLSGTPFVGRAGQLLDKMMAAIGLDRSNAYITNMLYWRPPGNRNPTPTEAAICRPFTERQIALVKPEILVFLGGQAAKQMLDTSEGIMRLRGKWRDFSPKEGAALANNGPIKAMATLHPAYLLRQPGQKKLAWQDFRQIQIALEESGKGLPKTTGE